MHRSALTCLRRPFALILVVLAIGYAETREPAAEAAQPATVKVDTAWFFDAEAVHPDGAIRAALQVKLGDNFHVQSNKPLDEFLVPTQLTVTAPDGIKVAQIAYPKAVNFDVAGEAASVFEPEFVIGIAFEVAKDAKPGVYAIKAALDYQACNERMCLQPATLDLTAQIKVVEPGASITRTNHAAFGHVTFSGQTDPPQTARAATSTAPDGTAVHTCDVVAELEKFEVIGTAGGFLGVDEFIQFVDNAEKGKTKANLFEGMGPVAIVIAVILGGIALNLTPCVLPLIPINLAIIGAGTQAGSRARGFALGGAYGLAMAVVYGGLGLIVTLTSTAFGAINSTIWFNIAIAILFVFLALAMFDVIAIDFTKYQSKIDTSKLAGRGTFLVAFFMGGVSALLAGACVAPVVIQVVVYAGDQYARGSTWALALPFFLGLGMALPWPFAGAGLSLLPKPGMWMVRVKQAMGVFILLFAIWYVREAWKIWDSTRVDANAVLAAHQEQLEGGWTPSICAGLADARSENKLVLVDMWATWCKNCLVMDKTTLKDSKVQERLTNYVKVKFQAQKLGESPNREMLERFEQVGLPAYAILRPKSPG